MCLTLRGRALRKAEDATGLPRWSLTLDATQILPTYKTGCHGLEPWVTSLYDKISCRPVIPIPLVAAKGKNNRHDSSPRSHRRRG